MSMKVIHKMDSLTQGTITMGTTIQDIPTPIAMLPIRDMELRLQQRAAMSLLPRSRAG
jgi:hypothetical protein